MPYEIIELAGKPYAPSNGDEGRRFMAAYCEHCIRDDPEAEVYCPILFRALAGTDNPDWIHDEQGQPKCTAYKPLTWDDEQRARAQGKQNEGAES